jgi:hypothetical protein
MTAKTTAVKISYGRTLAAIKAVTYDKVGLHIVLTPMADIVSIIDNINLGVFSGKNKLTEELIRTLLTKSKQSISNAIETAKVTRVIIIPITIAVVENTIVWLVYFEGKKECCVRFKL